MKKDKTFYMSLSLKSLFIPSNIEKIGRLAFAGSKQLEQVIITREQLHMKFIEMVKW